MIQIKQKQYIEDLNIRKLFWHKSNRHEDMIYRKTYKKCRKYLEKSLDLTKEINGFNGFYSKYVTILITCFCIIGSSTFLSVTKKGGETLVFLVIPFIIYVILFMSFVLLFNFFSSRTIYWNICLFKRLRQVQIRLLSKKCLNRAQIIKLDLVNEYKLLLQKCSFRLLNASTINNKLFAFTIFGCISVFYMKLVENGKEHGLI